MMTRPIILVFVCPTCGRSSPHPMDISERFCSTCGFADDNFARSELELAEAEEKPETKQ